MTPRAINSHLISQKQEAVFATTPPDLLLSSLPLSLTRLPFGSWYSSTWSCWATGVTCELSGTASIFNWYAWCEPNILETMSKTILIFLTNAIHEFINCCLEITFCR